MSKALRRITVEEFCREFEPSPHAASVLRLAFGGREFSALDILNRYDIPAEYRVAGARWLLESENKS